MQLPAKRVEFLTGSAPELIRPDGMVCPLECCRKYREELDRNRAY